MSDPRLKPISEFVTGDDLVLRRVDRIRKKNAATKLKIDKAWARYLEGWSQSHGMKP